MSREKKNRFYYSKNQNEIDEEMWNMPTRFTFVKTPDGWKQYSEWCSVKGVKCNWEDAELVYETDDEPEIIVHEGIPEFINDLEAKLAESEEQVKDLEFRNKNLEHSLKVAPNANAGQRARIVELKGINHQLKQQLAEKEKEYKESVEKILSSRDKFILEYNQDKISFAVKQLVNIQKYISDNAVYVEEEIFGREINDYIDNQIKQLKEGK